MTADEMEIVSPNTGKNKGFVDSENRIHDEHECQFAGDHSNGLNADDKCIICGKVLGDLIAESIDSISTKVPIIIDPKEDL